MQITYEESIVYLLSPASPKIGDCYLHLLHMAMLANVHACIIEDTTMH